MSKKILSDDLDIVNVGENKNSVSKLIYKQQLIEFLKNINSIDFTEEEKKIIKEFKKLNSLKE
jgi:hypothetical protein